MKKIKDLSGADKWLICQAHDKKNGCEGCGLYIKNRCATDNGSLMRRHAEDIVEVPE